MPYKDPDRKRQWEKEHREERNAKRRKYILSRSAETAGIDDQLPDPNSAHVPLTSTNVSIGAMMVLAFLLIGFILMRRSGSSLAPQRADDVHN